MSGCLLRLVFFFFFKQKTAYDMRISDWSSDVCSSDLSFIETLVPRAVSNGYRYIQSFVIYVAIMVVVYTGLSIVGPHVFAAFGLDGSTAGIADSDALVGSAQEEIGRAHV